MLPNAGPGSPANHDASAFAGTPDATPAEASGLDLPASGLSDIGALGGGGDVIGLPTGHGGGSGGGSGVSGGGGGGGSGSGGGASGGTGTGAGGSGGGGTTPPPGSGPSGPPTGGGGVSGVPEPATWALMLIGVGLIGGLRRRDRRFAISA